jgi:N4-gp56 family major capsid protein
MGKEAYGVVDPDKMGLQMIVKPLGSGDDPLNQRQTVGWKFMDAAKILYQERMVRLEVGSSYGSIDKAN